MNSVSDIASNSTASFDASKATKSPGRSASRTDTAPNEMAAHSTVWSRMAISSQRDIDGGGASGALPHAVFGRGPIWRTSVPPFTMSECSNHGLLSGLPFIVAD